MSKQFNSCKSSGRYLLNNPGKYFCLDLSLVTKKSNNSAITRLFIGSLLVIAPAFPAMSIPVKGVTSQTYGTSQLAAMDKNLSSNPQGPRRPGTILPSSTPDTLGMGPSRPTLLTPTQSNQNTLASNVKHR
jgi:hypothetical protein